MKKKRFLVVGLGVLGEAVARQLTLEGAEVIVVDQDQTLLDRITDEVAVAYQADVTDPKVLDQIGAKSVDAAVVCIGEDLEASVLCTANLLDLGVKQVLARANSRTASVILERIGAHNVFYVETITGKLIANKLMRPEVFQEMDLGHGFRVLQWKAPESFVGKTLQELELGKKFQAQVLFLKNENRQDKIAPARGDSIIQTGDTLVVSAHEEHLNRLLASN